VHPPRWPLNYVRTLATVTVLFLTLH